MYYPFAEGKAGRLRGRHKTADASEYLLAATEIVSLAKDVLSEDEYDEAEDLARRLTGNKRAKDSARARLVELVKPPPKRPIYYAQHELQHLPRWTRNALRYLGDYIDMLVRSGVYEKTVDRRVFNFPLGRAIDYFRIYWPEHDKLANLLWRYNHFLYRGAKHDFKLPVNRKSHRFTPREVVLTAFITMNLAGRLTAISSVARDVSNDKEI